MKTQVSNRNNIVPKIVTLLLFCVLQTRKIFFGEIKKHVKNLFEELET